MDSGPLREGPKEMTNTANKLVTLAAAIDAHVPSGSMVLLGAQLEQMIPFAAAYEIIRQGRRNLTLVGPISDALFDQMIGAGTVERVMAAWVGNASQGLGHCFRRAVENGRPNPVATVDYTNFTLALALHAAAMGAPFMPTHSAQGSEILKRNGNLREFASPVNEEKLIAVRALKPDVAIIHAQRADRFGNTHLWGNLGVAVDGARASRKIIVTAEEIVEPEVIASDPNRTLIPGFMVSAVAHAPWGAHPSPVQGHYGRDHAFFADYHERSRTAEGFQVWLAEWVTGPAGRAKYLAKLGEARRESLAVKTHAFSAPADFGY
jgi:glutaconate CoA-transferase, subunit A